MDKVAPTNATQPITICDEKKIMFSFENEVEIGLETTSNVEANETWEILTPKMLVDRNLWSPTHRCTSYWFFLWQMMVQ